MTLDSDTIRKLNAPLDMRRVHQREGGGGQTFSYLATHDAIRYANAIFGYGQWGHIVTDLTLLGVEPVTAKSGRPGNRVGYRCTVMLNVNGCQPTSGVGYGDAQDYQDSLITPHELAAKEAESDALKRALKNFGDQFGLLLYAKPGAERDRVEREARIRAQRAISAGEPGGGSGEPSPAAEPRLDTAEEAWTTAQIEEDLKAESSAGVETEESPSEARATPAEIFMPEPNTTFSANVTAGYMKTERGGGGTERVGGVETFPGPTFKEWAKPWLIDEIERDRIFNTRGFDHTIFEPWDKYRKDAEACVNLIRETGDRDVLILWRDREARTRARKGVGAAFQKQLDKIGGGTEAKPSDSGNVEQAPPLAGSEESAPAAADPLPETIQAVTALARMKAAVEFIRENPQSVDKPDVWTEQRVLIGIGRLGLGDYVTLDDVPEESLVEVWALVPDGVRGHIEGLDYETVMKMAGERS